MGFCCFCKPALVMDSGTRKGRALVIERRQSMTFLFERGMAMTEQQFQHAMGAAETFQRLAEEPLVADFWSGYIRGFRRRYHGEKFGTAEEHALWMAAVTSDDESRQRRGEGYRAGFAGASIEVAMAAAEKWGKP